MSDHFDPPSDVYLDVYATQAERDDLYAANPDGHSPFINAERPDFIDSVRTEYSDSLYPTNFIGSTEEALWNHYTTPPTDTRAQIFVSQNEGVVGVSVQEYIVAVTDESGAFAEPETPQDLTATIQQLGLSPSAIAVAIERAEAQSLDVNPAVSDHPAVEAARTAVAVQPNLTNEATPPPAPSVDPTDTPTPVDNRQIVYGYDPRLETFQATVWDGDSEPQTVGTTRGEHLTVDSLHSALTGTDVATNVPDDLKNLESDVRVHSGDYTIVGIKEQGDPRLFVVTPNQGVSQLTTDGEYSPDGFNWGYSGGGPSQASKALIDVVQGATAAQSIDHVRSVAGDLTSNLPDNFTISGADLSAAVDGRPAKALSAAAQPDAAALSAVRTHIDTPAAELKVETPRPDLGVSF